MLSAHALLIAAIFVPYMALMVGLGWYIYRTGHPRDPGDTGGQDEEDGRGGADPAADILPMAA